MRSAALSALGFAVSAALAPHVLHPRPVAMATALALLALAAVMAALAIDSVPTRKDPS